MSTSLYFSNKVAPKNLTWIYVMYFVEIQEALQSIKKFTNGKTYTVQLKLKTYLSLG